MASASALTVLATRTICGARLTTLPNVPTSVSAELLSQVDRAAVTVFALPSHPDPDDPDGAESTVVWRRSGVAGSLGTGAAAGGAGLSPGLGGVSVLGGEGC
jgi:hypothetical protein